MDFTFVDNVVHGHILAAQHLKADSVVCGKVCTPNNESFSPCYRTMDDNLI